MNIMVFDVPAESSGALSVLNDFYNEVANLEDKDIKWIFVISKPHLKETKNIKVLRYPWIKKSWRHRLLFDNFVAPKLVKQYKIDKVFSLQNIAIPRTKCEQIVYVHQALPFVKYKFGFIQNKTYWIYQNVFVKNIVKSLQKAEKIIVQTNWMKKACIEKSKIDEEKIEVIPPKINGEITSPFKPTNTSLKTFYYPASEMEYKNHQIIVDACIKLEKEYNDKFEVIFTLNGNENAYIESIFKQVKEKNLPIKFVGPMHREEVFKMYSKSILLFPSYIEAYGMPLMEARLHRTIIIASDTVFAREILEGYKNTYFFNPFNPQMLVDAMLNILVNKTYIEICEKDFEKLLNEKQSIINYIIS